MVFISIIKGLLAGFFATIIMTLSQTFEIKLTGRQPSTVPGQVASRLFRLSPKREDEMARLSSAVHWMHGIALGAVFGLIMLTGVSVVTATAIFFVLFWSGDVLLYKALGIAPFPWHWRTNELLTDVFHKGLYAITTGIIYHIITMLNFFN